VRQLAVTDEFIPQVPLQLHPSSAPAPVVHAVLDVAALQYVVAAELVLQPPPQLQPSV
jgi:hypothetical protein